MIIRKACPWERFVMCCNHIATLGKPRTVQRPLKINLSVLLWYDDIKDSLTHFASLINESRCIKRKTVIQLLEFNSISNYTTFFNRKNKNISNTLYSKTKLLWNSSAFMEYNSTAKVTKTYYSKVLLMYRFIT